MMNSEPLDELYFKWLYEQVADPEQGLTFWNVLRVLYTTPFAWVVPNDENRIADARELRERFIDTQRIRLHRSEQNWVELGCSMLEVMVGLAVRLEYMADKGKAHYWFWVLMENIGLSEFDDSRFDEDSEDHVREVLEMIIQRYYDPDGHGGFFPLENPTGDQREIELWYQLSAYVLERELAG
jgi:hypothetical protein